MTTEIPRHHRLLSVLDRLGVRSAHFAGQVPSDFAGLIADSPESIASLSLVCPEHVDAGAFGPVSDRLQAFAGDRSVADRRVRSGMEALAPSGRLIGIDDYRALTWSDVVADHADTVGPAIIDWANKFASDADDVAGAGDQFEVDGVRVAHLGDIGCPLTAEDIAALGPVDLLLWPVGGTYTLGPEDAPMVLEALKPTLAIPLHFEHPRCQLGMQPIEALFEHVPSYQRIGGSSVSTDEGLPDSGGGEVVGQPAGV